MLNFVFPSTERTVFTRSSVFVFLSSYYALE